MAGTSIVQAKQSLLYALEHLRAGDKFNVIRFDDTMETLFDQAVDATSENLAIAKNFVSRLDAEGGTEMLPALKAALKDATPQDTTRLRQVVFLTDGSVGNEAQLFAEITSRLGRSRLFTVGIGSAPNSYFMRRAAELGRGTFTEIGSEAQVLERMSALFAKLEKPVMVGLKAEWPKGTKFEVWPDPLPDLYAGEPVVLSAKVSSVNGELHLSGTFDGKPWTAALRLADAVEGTGVAKLWARSKIASLEAKLYSSMDDAGVEKAIEGVALEHHLVSSQTSLIAIDKSKSRPDGQGVASVDMPVNLPDGWVYDKVFGEKGAMQQAMKAAGRPITYDRSGSGFFNMMPSAPATLAFDGDGLAAGASQEAAPQADPAQIPDTTTLPQEAAPQADSAPATDTATVVPSAPDASQVAQNYPLLPLTVVPKSESNPLASLKAQDANQRITILALVLALLSAVTFILWRYHRRDYASPRRIGRRT
jgi:Ca-activated chloride channel family protein